MAGMVFTPRLSLDSGERAEMELSVEDHGKIRRGSTNWKAEVTDLKTGKSYLVKGAACGAPNCKCDAYIVRSL